MARNRSEKGTFRSRRFKPDMLASMAIAVLCDYEDRYAVFIDNGHGHHLLVRLFESLALASVEYASIRDGFNYQNTGPYRSHPLSRSFTRHEGSVGHIEIIGGFDGPWSVVEDGGHTLLISEDFLEAVEHYLRRAPRHGTQSQ